MNCIEITIDSSCPCPIDIGPGKTTEQPPRNSNQSYTTREIPRCQILNSTWFPKHLSRIFQIQIEFRLNSRRREPSGGPGIEPQWRTFSQYFENFKNSISLITFARRKVTTKCNIQKWPQEDEKSVSAIKNTFYFLSSSATVRTHTSVLFCFGRSLLA